MMKSQIQTVTSQTFSFESSIINARNSHINKVLFYKTSFSLFPVQSLTSPNPFPINLVTFETKLNNNTRKIKSQNPSYKPFFTSTLNYSFNLNNFNSFTCFSVENTSVASENDTLNNEGSEYSESSLIDETMPVSVENLGPNSRKVVAKVKIEAPLKLVWSTLTDYARLGEFIPSLTVNELIERKLKGAVLLQMAEQEIAFGLKFKAKAVVEVEEEDVEDGMEENQRRICFNMIEGDFKVFQGTWCMQKIVKDVVNEPDSHFTLLTYGVSITPQRWLPVAIIEGRMAREIQMNLEGVKNEVLDRWTRTQS